MRFCELKQKEVINTCTCKSLGCPIDLELDCDTGCITALIVPIHGKSFSFFSPCSEFVIPWRCIVQIGEDIILVKIQEDKCTHHG
ncbi:MAG: YlmC/YmxH family sporulation protein [Lachnospiraceae bacterium]|jgi:YlmC/YmxH family sporulation protein